MKNATVRSKLRVVALAAIFLSAPAQAQCDPADLFRAPDRQFTTGTRPYSVAIGDLDGDGTPDLAVANADSNTVSVLPGNGDGTFQARQDLDTGHYPRSVAIGDLDGDATPDLAVAKYDSNTVSVRLNQCAGSCQADLSGDGNLNSSDVTAFLTAFNAADPTADFNPDGLFNFFDVSAFLQAFNAGCP